VEKARCSAGALVAARFAVIIHRKLIKLNSLVSVLAPPAGPEKA
jgi:hypothetical protein